MIDDKSESDFRDRDRVSAEIMNFAEQNGLTIQQTMALIKKHGNGRDVLTRAARELRERGPSEAG